MLEKKKNFYPILTIAYVTFNRADLITRRIKKLLKNSLSPYVEVVVIDDNSKDNTFKKLKKLIKKNSIIKIYKNKKNLGFSGNYFEAIKRANGKYVLWASDKDGIYFNKIEKILNWILNINPDVTLLNYNRNLILKRNDPKYIRKNRTKKISFNEIWKCSHGPGIIWKRKAILQTINQWKIFDKTYPNFTKYYPNLLLLINILPKNNCFFYNGEITYQAEYPNYSHFLERENSYNFLGSRWKQHKELIDLLNNYAKKKRNMSFFINL